MFEIAELKTKIRGKKTLTALLVCGITFFAAIVFIYRPGTEEIARLKKSIKAEQKLNVLTKSIEASQRRISAYRLRGGPDKQLDWLLAQITQIAKKKSIKILSIDPQASRVDGAFTTIKCRVGIEAPYDKIGEFISNVESAKEFIRIEDLQVSLSPEKQGKDLNLRASFVFEGFFMDESSLPSIKAKEGISHPKYKYVAAKNKSPFDFPPQLKKALSEQEKDVRQVRLKQHKALEEKKAEQIPQQLPTMQLKGIVWGGRVPAAIIDDKVYRKGDILKGAKISKIVKEGVWLLYNGKEYLLKVTKR